MLINPNRPGYNSDKILSIFDDVATPEQVVAIDAGKRILDSTSNTSKVLIIKSGVAKLCVQHESKTIILGFCVAGDMLSPSLINGSHASYVVETVDEFTAYSWELSRIKEVASLFPEIKQMMYSINDAWIIWLIKRIKSIGLMNPRQRVADWLRDYLENEKYHNAGLWGKLSIEDMAAYCAMSREEFIYNLNNLIATGEVKLKNNEPASVS